MHKPRRFRSLPTEIEAMGPLSADNSAAIAAWCRGDVLFPRGDTVAIITLEGVMRASVGDWVVKGIQGEFYPVKPDIFAKRYVEIDNA